MKLEDIEKLAAEFVSRKNNEIEFESWGTAFDEAEGVMESFLAWLRATVEIRGIE